MIKKLDKVFHSPAGETITVSAGSTGDNTAFIGIEGSGNPKSRVYTYMSAAALRELAFALVEAAAVIEDAPDNRFEKQAAQVVAEWFLGRARR